jgi:GGDEF domain-containing protein
LPNCTLACAEHVIQRLQKATAGGLTSSAGAAHWDRGESASELQARADALLYRAKATGRAATAGARLHAV